MLSEWLSTGGHCTVLTEKHCQSPRGCWIRPCHHSCFPLAFFSFPFRWSGVLVFLGCDDDILYHIKEFPQEGNSKIHINGISLKKFNSSLLLAVLGLRCCTQASSMCGWPAPRGGFFCCGPQALGMHVSVVAAHGLGSCGSWALECGLSSCGAWTQRPCGTWDLPRPGTEPVSPALAGDS